VVKVGALAFILFLPTQYALDLQLLGGLWILQTFPALVFGLYTRWFRAEGLLLGWVVGIGWGTWTAWSNGMKPLASGAILKSNTLTATESLHYAMNLPTSVVTNGCDSLERLEQALHAARTFRPLRQPEVAALLAKTAAAGAEGKFELFKTSHNFDGTYHNPQWLG